MAFSVKVIGYSHAGSQLFDIEPPWWNARELRQDARMQVSSSDGYLDYDMHLSAQEARDLHRHFRPTAVLGVFADADWQAIIEPLLRELDTCFAPESDRLSYCRIYVYEWESGY